MQQRAPDIKGRRQLAGLDEIEADWNNVRATWDRALTQRDWQTIGQMMETLHLFCDMRARYTDGEILFLQAVSALEPNTGESPHPLWGELLVRTAEVIQLPESIPRYAEINELLDRAEQDANMGADPLYQWVRGRAVEFQRELFSKLTLLRTSLAGFQDRNDQYYAARVLRLLAWFNNRLGKDYVDQFVSYHQQYVDLARAIGDEIGRAHALFYAGDNALQQNQIDEAKKFLHEALAIWQKMRDRKSIGVVNNWLGDIAFGEGDFEQAKLLLEKAIRLGSEANYPATRNGSLNSLGMIACLEGELETARQIYAQLATHHRLVGLPILSCAEHNFQIAQHQLRQAFQRVDQFPILKWKLSTVVLLLPSLIIVLVHEGEYEQAVELLGVTFNQALYPTGWLERWSQLNEVRDELKTRLGADVYTLAWERGANRDLEAVVTELIAQYSESAPE